MKVAIKKQFLLLSIIVQLQSFTRSHPDLGTAMRAFQQAELGTRANMHFMELHYESLENWLRNSN